MPIVTVRRARLWLESVEDQVSADVGRVVQTSKSDLMARGVAFDLLQMTKRIGLQCKAAEYEDMSGEKIPPWIALLLMIGEAIGPKSDDTEELSMKAPMSVSNRRISGRGSRTVRLGRMVTGDRGLFLLPRFGPSRWR